MPPTDIFSVFKDIIAGRDAVVIECGCYDGYHTNMMSKVGAQHARSYRHIAVEPDVRVLGYTKRHVDARATIIEAAISDAVGKATFWLSSGSEVTNTYAGSSSINKPTKLLSDVFKGLRFDSTVEVKTITLDSLFLDAKLDHVDFIWADIQGAEKRMIKGGLAVCLPKTRYLYTEHGPGGWYADDATLADIVGLLPGWDVVHNFGSDVLMENKHFGEIKAR
jgi:FkbM family methyltransferase